MFPSLQNWSKNYLWRVCGISRLVVGQSLWCRPGAEPQSFLDGKPLVFKKCQLFEVEDILTWTKAFAIYQNSVICVVICASHRHRWSDLTKYKLLIIQNARQTPSRAWLPLEYDLTFRKDAAATGASDCSRMNFRLCLPPLSTSLPSSSAHPHQ